MAEISKDLIPGERSENAEQIDFQESPKFEIPQSRENDTKLDEAGKEEENVVFQQPILHSPQGESEAVVPAHQELKVSNEQGVEALRDVLLSDNSDIINRAYETV